MNAPRIVRFALVLFGGVVLVWIFGVDAGEGLLGKRRERLTVDPGSGGQETVPGEERSGETDVALTDAEIPVREELEDAPGVVVLQYVIHIGKTESAGAKRMPAEDVRIDLYNKKPPPEQRVVARVRGDQGTLDFASAPNAAAGFRDAAVDSMTLERNVRVEYLDQSGGTMATLEGERLDLSERLFVVPGRVRVEQEGMTLTGEHLHYDKDTGSFSVERDVVVTGTRFGLPEPGAAANENEEDGDDGAPPTVKTIRCEGRMEFVPAEDDDPDSSPASDAEGLASLRGGLLTFRGGVVGTQEDSELRCEELDVTLEDGPQVEGEAQGALEVTDVLARGTPTTPAVLSNPQGTLVGETLHLVKTEDGQVVTLEGNPAIRDASFGGDAEAGDATTRFDAGAATRIVVRPRPAETPVPPGDDVGAAPGAVTVLELRDDAFLETDSEDEGKRFRIEGRSLDLEFRERLVAVDAAEGEDTGDAGDAAERTKREMALERLIALGDARGVFAGGTFRGDEILAVPVTGEDGESSFHVTVSPNPQVTIVEPATDERPETRVTIESKDGSLVYAPPRDAGAPARAVFHAGGEPVTLRVEEGDVVTTTLLAHETIEVDLGGGEDAVSSLVATGAVSFRSVSEGVTGEGDRLTLLPAGDGTRKFLLTGAPATARLEDASQGRREVMARSIEFDPSTGELRAREEVEATIAGLAITEGGSPEQGGEAAAPGVLRCRDLRLTTREDGSTLLDAFGDVSFAEPERDLLATCDHLHYDESTGLATLTGLGGAPATVTRTSSGEDGAPPQTVGVAGPRIDLAQETGVLTCPDRGVVTLLRPAHAGRSEIRVVARSKGPVRSAEDRLILEDDVVVGFEEDGTEARALWCDLCTVYFREDEADAAAADESSETAGTTGGLDRIVAEGRVHLEQTAPRELTAEGQRLEWTLSGDDEVIFLSGTDPQAWVVGLLGDRDVRDEADWFRLRKNSDEVEAHNGRTVFVDV